MMWQHVRAAAVFALFIGWAPDGRTETLTVAGVAVVLPGTERQVSLLASACQSSARAVASACSAIARSRPDDRAIAYSALIDAYLSPLAGAAPLTAQDGRHAYAALVAMLQAMPPPDAAQVIALPRTIGARAQQLWSIARSSGDAALLDDAVALSGAAVALCRLNNDAACRTNNLADAGSMLTDLGLWRTDRATIQTAIDTLQLALATLPGCVAPSVRIQLHVRQSAAYVALAKLVRDEFGRITILTQALDELSGPTTAVAPALRDRRWWLLRLAVASIEFDLAFLKYDAPATRVGLQNYGAALSEIGFDAEPSSWATAKLNVANQYLNIATLTTVPGDTSAGLAAAAAAVEAWKTIGRPQSYAYARLVHAFALARNADADGRASSALARAAYAEALGRFTALEPSFAATGAQNWLDDIHSSRRWIAPRVSKLSAGR